MLMQKLLIAFYSLSNNIQSKAIMWQASIYKGKLFKFNHFLAWKSLWQAVFELCSSEIKITYKFKLLPVFIWIKLEESNLQVITSKNQIFES